jgi:DHA2 family multidrug resistance protein
MVFFYRAARAENPIVDLRVFRTPTFSIGVTLGFILGVCVFSTLFLQPLFLASVRGYSPLQVGETMFVQGATMLFAAPVIGYTMRYIRDTRPFGVLGFLLVAASCWLQAHMTADWGLEQLTWPQILRGIGLQFSFNAIMLPAISNLPPDLVHTGSGVFNTIRNIGGAFGIAILSTMQKYDIEAHRQQLYAALDPNNPHVTQMISGIEAYVERFGSAAPDRQALMYYASILDREAMVMTFNNQFLFLAIVLVIFTPAMLLLKPPPATIRVDAHG